MSDFEFTKEDAKVIVRALDEAETAEAQAQREDQAKADREKRRMEMEEAARLEVPKTIEKLRKEGAALIAEADQLEKMLQAFPNLRRREGRWKKIAYYTKDVNARVTRFDMRHNCGCCSDSPLEIWPYLETPYGKVYSDPPDFRVGERDDCYGGDIPYKGWDARMRDVGIPEEIIGPVRMIFLDSAERITQSVKNIYGGEKDPEEDEPPA